MNVKQMIWSLNNKPHDQRNTTCFRRCHCHGLTLHGSELHFTPVRSIHGSVWGSGNHSHSFPCSHSQHSLKANRRQPRCKSVNTRKGTETPSTQLPLQWGKRRRTWTGPSSQANSTLQYSCHQEGISHSTPSTLPALVPVGRAEPGLLIWRRTGSQSWLRTHKSCHNTKSSVLRQRLSCARRGCSAFMSLLSWEGGEKQHLSVCRADRRKEKSFQECVLGEAASAGALGRSLQQFSPPGACSFLMAQFTSYSPQNRSPDEDRCGRCPSLGVSQDPAAQTLPTAQSLRSQLLVQPRN